MIDNWIPAYELMRARQRELLAWAEMERAARSARRAHGQSLRQTELRMLPRPGNPDPQLCCGPCCEGEAARRSA
jgi:hypothetical protein